MLDPLRDEAREPVPDASVDVVNSSGAVGCHFEAKATAVLAAEVDRVLRPGGLALIDCGPDGTRPPELRAIFHALGLRAIHRARSCVVRPLLAALLPQARRVTMGRWLGGAPAKNYPDPQGPRYSGSFARERAAGLKVVTFNIRFARRIERTEELFHKADHLRGADVIALQEMDAPGTETLARELGYGLRLLSVGASPPDPTATSATPCSAAGRSSPRPQADASPLERAAAQAARPVTAADLRLPAGGSVRVYSVHLRDTRRAAATGARQPAPLAIAEDARVLRGRR